MTSINKSMLIHTAGVIALLLAAALTPQTATAQAPRTLTQLRVAFTYHPEDPAERIYAHLQATARDACADHGSRSLKLQAYEAVCARNLLNKAVDRIGRADITELNTAGRAPLTLATR